MSDKSVTRKLAAILSADMVGYSRLMEKDEEGTIARQNVHRDELIDPKVTAHHGRIVKTMGDGLLIEFPSVVEAFQCAIDIQNGMAQRNMDVPDDQKMLFRIGINVGDIIIEGDDIFGDGVNIAARLQEITDAGGVAVSATAYDHLAGRIDVALDDAGVQKLKNISRLVHIWRWPVADQQRPTDSEPFNRAAHDNLISGYQYYWMLSKIENARAKHVFKRAIELSPEFAPAYACLAESLLLDYLNQWNKKKEKPLESAYELAQKAVSLDDTSALAHTAFGSANLWRGRQDQSVAEYEKAIALDPNYADGHMGLSRALHYAGRSEDAIEPIERAMHLDLNYPGYYLHIVAQAQYQLIQYEEAIESLTRRITRDPKTDISRVLLAACYGQLGRRAEAIFEFAEALRVNPDYSFDHRRKVLPYKDATDFDHLAQGLGKADLPRLGGWARWRHR